MNTMRSLVVTIAFIGTACSALHAQRSDCKETKTPKHLPAASALIDSAAALQALAVIDAPEGMLFSLIFRKGDSLPHVRPLFETDTAAATVVTRWMRSQRPDSMWGVRIRVAQGPPASLQLERAIYCPPVLIPEGPAPATIVAPGVPMAARAADVQAVRPRRVGSGEAETETRVSENGTPLRVKLVQSSGAPDIDEQVVQRSLQARFHPALLDGMRVPSTYRPGGKSPRL